MADTAPSQSAAEEVQTRSSAGDRAAVGPTPKPYNTPIPGGRCALLELPEELLVRIFVNSDRQTITRCYRLCKPIREVLTCNSKIQLHLLLQCNSLTVNPHAFKAYSEANNTPLSSADLLKRLRDRQQRFRTFNPKQTSAIQYSEREGSLYEYLEGILLKSSGRDALAVYDLRKLSEWEDEEEGEEEQGGEVEDSTESEAGREIRTSKTFPFQLKEFAVDPGQDLLVVVEVRRAENGRANIMRLHLLSLSTFEPHPRAKEPVLIWPFPMLLPRIALGFQIADDGLFVLKHNASGGEHDRIVAWKWTTGKPVLKLTGDGSTSFESFVLLSPTSLVIPTIKANTPLEDLNAETAIEDLTWTHHIDIYTFPPISDPTSPPEDQEGEDSASTFVHTPRLVARVNMPVFHADILANIPPPRMSIRTDPPPRLTPPTHPIGNPSAFLPTPESGVIIMEIACQIPSQAVDPHYVLCMLKTTLLEYLPAPDSPILQSVDPAPPLSVPWEAIAPRARFMEGFEPSSWVCYLYQNRYCIPMDDDEEEDGHYQSLRILDFDPIRVRQEINKRSVDDWREYSKYRPGEHGEVVGSHGMRPDGIATITRESVTTINRLLHEEIESGREFPFMYVDKKVTAEVALVDGERIIGVVDDDRPLPGARFGTRLEVMEF